MGNNVRQSEAFNQGNEKTPIFARLQQKDKKNTT